MRNNLRCELEDFISFKSSEGTGYTCSLSRLFFRFGFLIRPQVISEDIYSVLLVLKGRGPLREKMQFNLVLFTFLCNASWSIFVQATHGPVVNCCIKLTGTKVTLDKVQKYTIQSSGACPIYAVKIVTKQGKTLCADPNDNWTKKAMEKVDKEKQPRPATRTKEKLKSVATPVMSTSTQNPTQTTPATSSPTKNPPQTTTATSSSTKNLPQITPGLSTSTKNPPQTTPATSSSTQNLPQTTPAMSTLTQNSPQTTPVMSISTKNPPQATPATSLSTKNPPQTTTAMSPSTQNPPQITPGFSTSTKNPPQTRSRIRRMKNNYRRRNRNRIKRAQKQLTKIFRRRSKKQRKQG
ncbi:probable GPI-anchored adhesin-like protein PGA18 isoform X3 [Salarias fasciatus]|uniref:probable GPI-anchored adhesin-like protein PGA18 isoform X3 n=1 Tax=Salarias fasciatus TaxID=181472 RepID=UPI001176CC68|nr:probable GPI-anchored adhesin-like protein PGA18 isoform X3 [Salarias fasciatus]